MSKLFEGSKIDSLALSNRIIRSATHEGMSDERGRPTEELSKLYTQLARGGVGAIITGFAAVQPNGWVAPNMLMFDKDEYIGDYKKILEPVKKLGAPVILQLAHGGGQIDPVSTKTEAVAPSRLRYPLSRTVARALSEAEIEEVIENFIKAIARAEAAGFDGVQLHAAHGYLLFEFLSPYCNRRTDKWGKNTEGRFQIISEILKGAKQELGSYPVLIKYSAYDAEQNGITLDEAINIAQLYSEAGGAAIEVSSGGITLGFHPVRMTKLPIDAIMNLHPNYRNKSALIKRIMSIILIFAIKMLKPIHNYNLAAASEIKKHVNIPVIVTGGIRSLDVMESALENEQADYISLSRPLIIEPGLVNKFIEGKQDHSKCIDCGYCLVGVTNKSLRCYHGKLTMPK